MEDQASVQPDPQDQLDELAKAVAGGNITSLFVTFMGPKGEVGFKTIGANVPAVMILGAMDCAKHIVLSQVVQTGNEQQKRSALALPPHMQRR